MENFMKILSKLQSVYSQKKKGYIFLLILSFVITFLLSISLNSAGIQSSLQNLDYADYPVEYSAYSTLQVDTYENFMSENFHDLDYHFFYYKNDNPTTNIIFEDLEVQVIGCQSDFQTFPLPSAYSNSIVSTQISEGESFTDVDIFTQSNGMIMYGSHLDKIGYQLDDEIKINGKDFVLEGVLEDNSDIKRNIDENTIQIFIPYTTYSNLFTAYNVETVIHTENYTFEQYDDEYNFISYYKVLDMLNNTESYIISSSYFAIAATFLVSFIATAIVQIILIRGRYNEIGIRRAIGASRDSIVYLFTKKSLNIILIGALMGFLTFLILLFNVEILLSNIYFTNFFIFNFNDTCLYLVIYIFFSYLSVLIPSIIGTRINIATILVEER